MALTELQQKFVFEYLKTGDSRRAAIAAGYSESTAGPAGSRLLNHPEVSQLINGSQTKIQEKGIYNLEKALEQAEDAYQVAKKKGNGAAMTAAATLKSKLSGLMIDRSEVKQVGFQINITGYDDK